MFVFLLFLGCACECFLNAAVSYCAVLSGCCVSMLRNVPLVLIMLDVPGGFLWDHAFFLECFLKSLLMCVCWWGGEGVVCAYVAPPILQVALYNGLVFWGNWQAWKKKSFCIHLYNVIKEDNRKIIQKKFVMNSNVLILVQIYNIFTIKVYCY